MAVAARSPPTRKRKFTRVGLMIGRAMKHAAAGIQSGSESLDACGAASAMARESPAPWSIRRSRYHSERSHGEHAAVLPP